jgi:hypothetical protein
MSAGEPLGWPVAELNLKDAGVACQNAENDLRMMTEQRDAALWCLDVATQERNTYKEALKAILNASREVSTVNIAKKALENPLP